MGHCLDADCMEGLVFCNVKSGFLSGFLAAPSSETKRMLSIGLGDK